MGCAGVATYNALRKSVAGSGDLVAVLGMGGLGHLGVQFANKLGFETVAIARGTGKADEAIKLGAHHYIDSTAGDVATQLQALGGANVVLATVTTNDQGGFAFDNLVPGTYRIRATRSSSRTQGLKSIDLLEGQELKGVEVKLYRR